MGDGLKIDFGVNMETVKFMKMIDELVKKQSNGMHEFRHATRDNFENYIFYDSTKQNPDGTYKIVFDACLMPEHHDALAYYETYCVAYDGFTVGVMLDENDDDNYIQIEIDGEYIIINNGTWFVTE